MNTVPAAGAPKDGALSGAGEAKASPAPVFSGRGKFDEIHTVWLFIPKRLAHRLAQTVQDLLSVMSCTTADHFLQKEALLDLQKALKRAGYKPSWRPE